MEEVKSRWYIQIWKGWIHWSSFRNLFSIFVEHSFVHAQLKTIAEEYHARFSFFSKNEFMKNLFYACGGCGGIYYSLFIELPCTKADITEEYSPIQIVYINHPVNYGVIASCDYCVEKGIVKRQSWWLKFPYCNFRTDILPILNSQHELCVRYGNQQRVDWYVPLPEDVRYLIKQFL